MSNPPERVRVVLDTNIVVSALIGRVGAPAKVFEKVLGGEIENIASEPILKEMEEVLSRPEVTQRTIKEDREFFLQKLKEKSNSVKTSGMITTIKEDPSDNKFLEAAIEGKAKYIISGDHHLLELKEFKGTRIVKAKEFLELAK